MTHIETLPPETSVNGSERLARNDFPTDIFWWEGKPLSDHPVRRSDVLVCKGRTNRVRWREGERLQHLFERRCDELDEASGGPQAAVITEDATLTFCDLDNRANQAARYLIANGIRAGDRIGLLFDKSANTYVALLAVLKVNAAYVPFDGAFPNERIAFILEDAGVKAILSQSQFAEKLAAFAVPSLYLDTASAEIDRQDAARLRAAELGPPTDEVAYLIYTSGTTGQPKGVVIEHASICNFVRVAAEIYGYGPRDRVYQGMTIAFDFSVEELWVPLLAGSALVPAKAGTNLVGAELGDYLEKHNVTGLACVPTLLATIDRDLPKLRLLIVSGEACPQNLVERWHRPGRTILNAYGPTETTVTCTLTELVPHKRVTIGGPLPTYSIVILDPDKAAIVPRGELGEIGIAGIGLAQGYLGRPELTAQKFIPDFLSLPNNPSKRIYRSGDLGRINADDEVEFHGRIDTQVKIRGYRIELTEIESVLMEFPEIAQAVVDTYEPEPGAVELVAYYSLNSGMSRLSHGDIAKALRARLPSYMVPAYFELLPVIPMTPSNKADRKRLPAPKGARFAGGNGKFVAPGNDREAFLAEKLAEVLKIDRVSVEDNFFLDLGAHSLLMACFCSAIRERADLTSVSMRDIYLHPTIAELAKHIGPVRVVNSVQPARIPLRVPSRLDYCGCGVRQLLFYGASGLFGLWVLLTGFHWTHAAVDDPVELYMRMVAYVTTLFVGLNTIAVALKWMLIGQWREEAIPIWSLRYFRFWLVKAVTRAAPMAFFVGTPIYNFYLRALGARIGRSAVIASPMPISTDLFRVGDNTIIRAKTLLPGYKAQANYIHIGPIQIGDNAYVGAASVIDINTVMENGAQLGNSSALQSGQRIPEGKHFHGTPAEETTADYCTIRRRGCGALRRWLYALTLLTFGITVLPLPIMALYYLFPHAYEFTGADELTYDSLVTVVLAVGPETLLLSLALFTGFFTLGLIAVYIIPGLLHIFVRPDKVYRLYGFHYLIQSIISAASNSRFYNLLFGDSSYIIHYLEWAGYYLNGVVQTGANFGLDQVHDNPFLCDIGSGTMVSDGLAMANVEMSNSSFKVGKVVIGAQNYLGNNIYFPSSSRTGANCLLATKVMIPIDGPIREDTGLLGSPSFEIPRAVERDRQLAAMDKAILRQRLRTKNRRNLVTIAAYLLSNWFWFFVTLLSAYVAMLYYPHYGAGSLIFLGFFLLAFNIGFFVIVERASLGFGRLRPQTVTMYDEYFWFHERHWKFCGHPLMSLFNGTPFKPLISRLLGVKLGRMVFDDGVNLYDKTLIEIGDYANLNAASVVQGHSLEEGMFKSDRVTIGSGCTLDCGAFVHYGVIMGDNAVLGPNAFLMKGENVPPNSVWHGNPASEVREARQPDRAIFTGSAQICRRVLEGTDAIGKSALSQLGGVRAAAARDRVAVDG